MARFSVGQVIPVICFSFPKERKVFCHETFFCPWEIMPLKYDLVMLTVTEHHRVPNEWDEKNELNCDGFILQDTQGNIWHNQYPRASYGQLDDSQDRKFHRPDWHNGMENFQYVAFFHYLEELLHGAYTLQEMAQNSTTITEIAAAQARMFEAQSLVDWYNKLVTEYERKYACELQVGPFIFHFKDGRPPHQLKGRFEITEKPILKPSSVWFTEPEFYGWKLLDPDGWDRSSMQAFSHSWKEPITKQEFLRRLNRSTVQKKAVT